MENNDKVTVTDWDRGYSKGYADCAKENAKLANDDAKAILNEAELWLQKVVAHIQLLKRNLEKP